ncbi:MAG: phosphotransferase [Gammaproteobacteria bacterium]
MGGEMAVNELDHCALDAYLAAQMDGFGQLRESKKFSGGQSNPTFLLTTSTGRFVLRRKPPGVLLKSAHAVDREFRVIRALASTNVPVATGYHLCEDDEVIGSVFYVMEFVDGQIFWDPTLPDHDADQRRARYDEMNRVLAALHGVDVDAVGLTDFGQPGNYFERQVGRWTKQYRASETHTIEAMDALILWLSQNMPADDGHVSLVHGDYRLDNFIFSRDQPHISAVVDWELSTLGHPLADLAYQCMQWRMPHESLMKGLGGIDREALGIPAENDYVADYCRRTGRTQIDHWTFYLAFCFFRLAAIVQGVRKRALDGNASSARARAVGELTQPLAQAAMALIDE